MQLSTCGPQLSGLPQHRTSRSRFKPILPSVWRARKAKAPLFASCPVLQREMGQSLAAAPRGSPKIQPQWQPHKAAPAPRDPPGVRMMSAGDALSSLPFLSLPGCVQTEVCQCGYIAAKRSHFDKLAFSNNNNSPPPAQTRGWNHSHQLSPGVKQFLSLITCVNSTRAGKCRADFGCVFIYQTAPDNRFTSSSSSSLRVFLQGTFGL